MARQLIEAIRNGEQIQARNILLGDKYGCVDCQTAKRDGTALFWACAKGFLELVQLLIAKGANVDARTNYNSTPLIAAADTNRYHVMRVLIESGADVNAQTSKGDTACHLAAYRGHLEAVRILLAAGADVDVTNTHFRTPIDDAIREGHVTLLPYLEGSEKTDVDNASSDAAVFTRSPHHHHHHHHHHNNHHMATMGGGGGGGGRRGVGPLSAPTASSCEAARRTSSDCVSNTSLSRESSYEEGPGSWGSSNNVINTNNNDSNGNNGNDDGQLVGSIINAVDWVDRLRSGNDLHHHHHPDLLTSSSSSVDTLFPSSHASTSLRPVTSSLSLSMSMSLALPAPSSSSSSGGGGLAKFPPSSPSASPVSAFPAGDYHHPHGLSGAVLASDVAATTDLPFPIIRVVDHVPAVVVGSDHNHHHHPDYYNNHHHDYYNNHHHHHVSYPTGAGGGGDFSYSAGNGGSGGGRRVAVENVSSDEGGRFSDMAGSGDQVGGGGSGRRSTGSVQGYDYSGCERESGNDLSLASDRPGSGHRDLISRLNIPA